MDDEKIIEIFRSLSADRQKEIIEYAQKVLMEKEDEDNTEIVALDEISVYSSNKLSIHVDPVSNRPSFKYNPYIKVLDSNNDKSAKSIARIYLKDCRVDYSHRNRNGRKEDLIITSSIANKLNKIMDLSVEYSEYENHKDENGRVIRKKVTNTITVYDYIWKVIWSLFPDAEYISKPDFRNCHL